MLLNLKYRNYYYCKRVISTVNLLLELNIPDNAGNTPLHIAVENESLEAIEFLLQQ